MTTAYSYVRFSSKKQADGDSEHRQLEASRRYAREQGWALDESLRDQGISAWSGKHRQTGNLAKFLRLVESGNVQPGSWLIVEAMDRLSREQITTALPVFMDIVNSGVGVVTLVDQKQYTQQGINKNPFELMYSIGLMSAANEYSMKLSSRVKAARETALKDLNAGTRKIVHGKPPFWITINRDTNTYEFDPTRRALLNRIVAWAMEGWGAVAIAKQLNREHVPTIRRTSRGWEDTTIQFTLRNRNLIGEYQPTHVTDGKRTPTGDPIKGYYPVAMSEMDFYRLQSILDTRKKASGGNTGENVANIFGKALVSGQDGGTMILVSHITPKKRYTSLASNHSIRGMSKMKGQTFPYDEFESAFLNFVDEVEPTKTAKVDHRSEVIRGELVELRGRITKLDKMLASGAGDFDRGVELLKKMNAQERDKVRELEAAQTAEHAPAVGNKDVVNIAHEMAEADGDKRTEIRTRLKLAIAQLCEKIKIYIAVEGVTRAAVGIVEFKNGQKRAFGVRVERYQAPVMVLLPDVPTNIETTLTKVLAGEMQQKGWAMMKPDNYGPPYRVVVDGKQGHAVNAKGVRWMQGKAAQRKAG